MKFNFDKLNTPEPEPKTPEKVEITQEEFDAQIEQEANKLKTSTQELAKEIEKWGGPEEFKRKMEKVGATKSTFSHYGGNEVKGSPFFYNAEGESGGIIIGKTLGKDIHDDLEYRSIPRKDKIDFGVMSGSFLVGVSTALDIILEKSSEPFATGVVEMFEKIQDGSFMGGDAILPVIVTFFTALAGGGFASAIHEKIRANKVKRELKKQELKHKMTGAELK